MLKSIRRKGATCVNPRSQLLCDFWNKLSCRGKFLNKSAEQIALPGIPAPARIPVERHPRAPVYRRAIRLFATYRIAATSGKKPELVV